MQERCKNEEKTSILQELHSKSQADSPAETSDDDDGTGGEVDNADVSETIDTEGGQSDESAENDRSSASEGGEAEDDEDQENRQEGTPAEGVRRREEHVTGDKAQRGREETETP